MVTTSATVIVHLSFIIILGLYLCCRYCSLFVAQEMGGEGGCCVHTRCDTATHLSLSCRPAFPRGLFHHQGSSVFPFSSIRNSNRFHMFPTCRAFDSGIDLKMNKQRTRSCRAHEILQLIVRYSLERENCCRSRPDARTNQSGTHYATWPRPL